MKGCPRQARLSKRGFHLRGDESLDGEEVASVMRLFAQFLRGPAWTG